jgi:transcriptional regulator with XRE-family HTH domain
VTLQELCAARGLTLADLAERVGVPFTIVAKIDAGTIRAQPTTLDRLAAPLGLTREALRAELSAARRLRPRPAARQSSRMAAPEEGAPRA